MLAAVTTESDRYEGLRDYIVGNKRPGASVRPRLPNKPGDSIPGINGKIKVSSQRPGKRTNDTIVYGRLVFTEFNSSPASPCDVLPGDVVMLHKSKNALGHDTNRPTKVASWRQINDVLQSGKPGTLVTRDMRDRILAARKAERDAMNDRGWEMYGEIRHSQQHRRPLNRDLLHALLDLSTAFAELDDEIGKLERNDPTAVFLPTFDWAAVAFLGEWTPDGLLVSRDDDEQNASYFHSGGGDSGVMMNVAVHGPATARNSTANKAESRPMEFAQIFDSEPRVRDDLYMCLVCKENTDDAGHFVAYSFRLKPTSSRIVEELSCAHWQTNPDAPYPNKDGMTAGEVANTVFAWRIGSIMDNRQSTLTEPKIQVNVAIIPVTLFELHQRFGPYFGSSHSPGRTFFVGTGSGLGSAAPPPGGGDGLGPAAGSEAGGDTAGLDATLDAVRDEQVPFPGNGLDEVWTKQQVWSLWLLILEAKDASYAGMTPQEKARVQITIRDLNRVIRRNEEVQRTFGFITEGRGLFGDQTPQGKANNAHFQAIFKVIQFDANAGSEKDQSGDNTISFVRLLAVLTGNELAGSVPAIGDIEAGAALLVPHISRILSRIQHRSFRPAPAI